MKARLTRYVQAYFSSWWLPLAHYAAVLVFLALFVATGLFAMSGFAAVVSDILAGLLVLAALGMFLASCVNYRRKCKLNGLANLMFFACLFLFPALMYAVIVALLKA
jgi:hypothetical protein